MSTTLLELRTRSRERSDMENSNFISPTELLSYINGSYAELYDLMVGTFEDYYTASTDLTVASGANTIPLPTDFYKLRGLDYKIDNSNYVTVRKFNFSNRNTVNRSTVYTGSNRDIQYRMLGQNIHLEPESNAPGEYKLWYTPKYTALIADTDTVDGLNGFEEYIVIDVAIKMLAKEESSTSHLEREKQAMLQRIEAMAQNRDSGAPETITDIYDSESIDRIF